MISRKFEIGAPSFDQRLEAAWKVQRAGYPLRLRLDPIVPFDGWQKAYAGTVEKIFQKVAPERITLGTLRFEEGFYHQRESIFTTGDDLPEMLSRMEPMFEPKRFEGKKRPKVGKYSFSEQDRVSIFGFIIQEIRKYSNCHIALCEESAAVWNQLGLDLSKVRCVCQLD
jgi:spore photoproduct lyase